MKQHPVAILPILSFALAIPMRAQDATRHIWDTAFLAPKTEKNTKSQAARKPRYTVLTPKVPFQNVDPSTVVGITVWRLQEHRPGDGGERLLGHNGSKTVELEPKRVSAQTLFSKDDKVRITVETAREGYLYIVDRERYANGKQGEPYLIFPVTTIRGGENHVLPGHIFELPAQDDDPPYFDMGRSRPDQVGEQITLLITPAPLKDLAPKEDRQRLAPEQYVQFEKESDISAGIAEATANQRLGWSKEEKSAGRDPALGLSATAPLPQTLFYGPDSSAQKPTMLNLVLTYAPLGRPSKSVR
jgi:hypothetical protein